MFKPWKHYLEIVERFDLPGPDKRRLALKVVPRLIGALELLGIQPMGGYDLSRIPPIMARHPQKPRVSEVSDPVLNPNAGPHDTFVVVFEKDGRDVACACVRLKWIETSLDEAYRSQSLLLEDPGTKINSTRWLCRAWVAKHEIRSMPVLISNGLCVLPIAGQSARDRETTIGALMRLLHLAGYGLFKWSWLLGHAIPKVAAKHAHFTDGFQIVDNGLARIETAGTTDYLFMAGDRLNFGELVRHPSFADLTLKLGQPSTLVGEG